MARPRRGTIRVGVDIGGTFTDLVAHDDVTGVAWTGKLLTTPEDPGRAIREGILRLLGDAGRSIGEVSRIVHGTTLITNTLLERTGARIGLLATAGFRDVLEMGRETRYDVDDLYARAAPVLVERTNRLGVRERMSANGAPVVPLDEPDLLEAARVLVEDRGVESLAIAFLNSYANPQHEMLAVELISSKYPDLFVTSSAQVAAEMGELERTNTACVNAYVQPQVHRYLERLEDDLAEIGFSGSVNIMLSAGGLTTVEEAKTFPVRLIESGPAAGAMAAAFVARRIGEPKVVSFDMGGTTAKMCVVDDGTPDKKRDFEAGRVDRFKRGSGIGLRISVVDMIEIGAGGGTLASVDDLGLLKVGPRSAGSVPGPVSYGLGGTEPTVTDADLLSGYLNPDYFLGGEIQLSLASVEAAMDSKVGSPLDLAPHEVAAGIREVVDESMAAATRMHLAEKGRDPGEYTLIAFGGAGPSHAYSLAKRLNMRRVVVPKGAGVLSAFGFLVAPPSVDDVRGYASLLDDVDWAHVRDLYASMESRARQVLADVAGSADEITVTRSADMRYVGQGFELEIALPEGALDDGLAGPLHDSFVSTYRALFGHTSDSTACEVISWRLSAHAPEADIRLTYDTARTREERPARMIDLPGCGRVAANVYDRYSLTEGQVIAGPAIFEERESSCSVGPDAEVRVDGDLNLLIEIDPDRSRPDAPVDGQKGKIHDEL